ncbi:MAG: alpha/beta fold hydrolase, partial [Gammaproteobacteria bacterium]|nr:alpha/beta fold hydrolase [Gammaproteobacteria bacterium]
EIFGRPEAIPVIVVHGGPGGDYEYLRSLQALSKDYRVIFYDQRGTGLSPRVDKKSLTLEQNLDDLNDIVDHFSNGRKVKLIGHSWGGMLVTGYLSKYPEKVSQAVVVEPGILNVESARADVKIIKASQSIGDVLVMARYLSLYPFVRKDDGQEGYDYVMAGMMSRSQSGPPYQCEGQAMPAGSFTRPGYAAMNNTVMPMLDNPELFTYDLTSGISRYRGGLLLVSSDCSALGYAYQEKYHAPKLPAQTIHVKANGMGHNMLTLNPEWSLKTIGAFLKP